MSYLITPSFIQNAGPMGILLIAVVVLVLFGRGKISSLMGEVGKGITAFKKGVNDGTKQLVKKVLTMALNSWKMRLVKALKTLRRMKIKTIRHNLCLTLG